MTRANDLQIGGAHYRTDFQHWDLIAINGIGYLEGCATKYMTRWPKKNGRQDVEKARHYVLKALELYREGAYMPAGRVDNLQFEAFAVANDLDADSKDAVRHLLYWTNEVHLELALGAIDKVLAELPEQTEMQQAIDELSTDCGEPDLEDIKPGGTA